MVLSRTRFPLFRARPSQVYLLLLFALIFSNSSCSVTDYVSAYFNTYYNALHLFSEAETETFTLIDARPGGRNWLNPFIISAASRTKLDKVIEKCSKLLQYHPNASLVDDALMMIGKAYYYEDENQKAERKFREIIDTYPGSDMALEAELLLAFSMYRMNQTEDARAMGRKVVETAKQEGADDILARVSLLLAQLDVEDKNYAAASEDFGVAAKYGKTPDQRSGAYLRVAEMYTKIGKYAEAEAAYRNAELESNTYIGEYRAKIGALRMRAKQGNYDGALKGLLQLRSNTNYREFFNEIECETGNLYRDMGDTAKALEQYRQVTTTYPHTEGSANAYFELGNLFESRLFQYDSAAVAYGKSKGEFPTAEITAQARERSDYMSKYLVYIREIHRYDSLRTVLLAPKDTLARQSGGDTASARVAAPKPAGLSLDSIDAKLASDKNELGGLFFGVMGKPDSAEYWFARVLKEHPSTPYVPRALYTLAQIYNRDSLAHSKTIDSLYHVILEAYPRSEFAVAVRRILGIPQLPPEKDEAEAVYLEGERLLVAGKTDSAMDTFSVVVSRYPSSPFASKALYATGWLYENELDHPDSARSVYERLVALYPASRYADRVRGRLAVEASQKESATPVDSLANVQPAKRLPVRDEELPAREGRGRPPANVPPPQSPSPSPQPQPQPQPQLQPEEIH